MLSQTEICARLHIQWSPDRTSEPVNMTIDCNVNDVFCSTGAVEEPSPEERQRPLRGHRRMAVVEDDFPLVLRAEPRNPGMATRCDHCDDTITGRIRYKCLHCAHFDLCEECGAKQRDLSEPNHAHDHTFIQLFRSGPSPEPYVALLAPSTRARLCPGGRRLRIGTSRGWVKT